MNVIPSGEAYSAAFDLSEADIVATSATYTVVDQDGTVLVASTAVPGYVSGDIDALIPVAIEHNTLVVGVPFGAREVRVTLSDGVSTALLLHSYRVAAGAVLQVPTTSFMTLLMANMLAEDVTGIPGWTAAVDEDKVKALRSSFDKMANLLLRDDFRNEKDYAGYGMTGGTVFRISDLSLSEWDSTSSALKLALRTAQLLEADHSLSTGGVDLEDNVQSIRIGESSRSYFRPSKAPLVNRAMSKLGRFLAPTRVARG